jgi:hypothetical protein
MRYFIVSVENDSILIDGKEQPCSVEHLQAAIDYWGTGYKVSEIKSPATLEAEAGFHDEPLTPAGQIDLSKFIVGQQTRDEFESQFAQQNDFASIAEWKAAGFDSVLCRCGEIYCSGWQMIKRYGNPGVAR